MTSVGLIPGLNQDGWRRYEPQLLCAGAGGETQPSGINDSHTLGVPTPFGRYLIVDRQYVQVEMQFGMNTSSVVGAGSAYVMSLPVPANRWTGRGLSSAVPLGLGMAYIAGSVAPNANMPITITLAEPFASLAGQEDSYVQCYCPYIIDWGSGTLAAAATTTVSHKAGFAPRAEDIVVNFTSTDTTTTNWSYSIQNITTTTFDLVFRGNPGGTPTFSYKIRAKPPTGQAGALMSPTVPWDWATKSTTPALGCIFLKFSYEPKR